LGSDDAGYRSAITQRVQYGWQRKTIKNQTSLENEGDTDGYKNDWWKRSASK
jgi:hypothetical protein